MSERTAVITGAAAGIGRATARLLTRRGFHVVAVDLAPIDDESVTAVRGDITAPHMWYTIREACAGHHPTILVNCAFSEERGPLLNVPDAGWERTFDVSLHAAIRLARGFVAGLPDGTPAAIVNVASVHASAAAPDFGPYSAAKAGLIAFTRTAAVEWGPRGVRVNAVAPAFIAVDRNEHIWRDPIALAKRVQSYPLRRVGAPEDVAHAIAFLASAEASFISGAVLPVDGGLMCQIPEDHS